MNDSGDPLAARPLRARDIAYSFHHVGIGTTQMAAAVATYEALGHRLLICVIDAGLAVKVAFLRPRGNAEPLVELLSPIGSGGPLDALIRRKVLPAPYHTCYAVSDMTHAREALHAASFMPLTEPRPALAMDGALIAFFYHAAVGLLELVENPPDFALPGPEETARFRAVAASA